MKKSTGTKRMTKASLAKLKTGGMLAALVAAMAVFIAMILMERNILTQYEKGTIYVAAKAIPRGQVITEDNYREYLSEKELDKSCIPPTALSSPEQIRSLAAVFDIEAGVLLTGGMFESLDSVWGEMEEPVIAGFKAEDIYQLAGGVLRAGDRIHIYYVEDGEAVLAWESVYVQQAFDISGKIIPNSDKITVAQRMNVYFDKKDVEAFYSGLARGSLRAVKVCD